MQGFLEWAGEHASRLYPDVGLKSYVVPPIFVHQHSSRYDHTTGADMMQHFQKSSPKGEKAHYYVTRAMDVSTRCFHSSSINFRIHLGLFESDICEIFVIMAGEYVCLACDHVWYNFTQFECCG